MSFKPRSHIVERPGYKPTHPQEAFIVPLLHQYITEALNSYASNPKPEARVIDIGCGRQPFRKDLELLGYHYIGFDVKQNPEEKVDVIAEIDTNFLHKYPRLGEFEFIICTEVLEHVAQWHIAFENLFRMTAPAGKVLITCPQFYPLHEEPYDFWRPTNHALEYYATKVGFQILEQTNAGDIWDILGTTLGSYRELYLRSSSLKSKIIYRLIRYSYKWILKQLLKKNIQRHVGIRSLSYLSNVIVLQK